LLRRFVLVVIGTQLNLFVEAKMNRLNHCLIVLALVAGCGGAHSEQSTASSSSTTHTASSTQVSSEHFESVLADSATRAPGTQPFEVEIERWNGSYVIEVEVAENGTIRDLYYDPSSGAFVGEEPESVGNQSSFAHLTGELSAGHASLANALAAARRDHPGNLRQVEVQSRDGRLVVEVAVEGEGQSYLYDAASGSLIGRDTAGEGDGDGR
jgi:uncharacterized membrane protein YkoI